MFRFLDKNYLQYLSEEISNINPKSKIWKQGSQKEQFIFKKYFCYN